MTYQNARDLVFRAQAQRPEGNRFSPRLHFHQASELDGRMVGRWADGMVPEGQDVARIIPNGGYRHHGVHNR